MAVGVRPLRRATVWVNHCHAQAEGRRSATTEVQVLATVSKSFDVAIRASSVGRWAAA